MADEFDHNNIIDICGSEQSSTVVRRTGYVKSPGYPVAYPHDTECVCEIEADFGTNIELQVKSLSRLCYVMLLVKQLFHS